MISTNITASLSLGFPMQPFQTIVGIPNHLLFYHNPLINNFTDKSYLAFVLLTS